MLTVQDIQDYRSALGSITLQEGVSFLSKIGNYFEQTIPSHLELSFIYETEALINELYIRSLHEPSTSGIAEQLLEAISQAGSIAIAVKHESFGAEFVRNVKQLGRTLIRISRTRI